MYNIYLFHDSTAFKKRQAQVRQDLCRAAHSPALDHKCRVWPSVGHAGAVVRSGFQAQVGGFNLGGGAEAIVQCCFSRAECCAMV